MFFQDDINYVMSLLKLSLQKKLDDRGHGKKETSKLIQSIEYETAQIAEIFISSMYGEDYGVFVESGVKAGRIPFSGSRRRGRGGKRKSEYIQGLIRFFQFKLRKSEKEAKAAAFATAHVHKREGMSTIKSRRFSKDGKRNGFISDVLSENEKEIFGVLEQRIGDKIDANIQQIYSIVAKQVA